MNQQFLGKGQSDLFKDSSTPCPVWPDWVIFEFSWQQILLQKQPKYLVTFWQSWKPLILSQTGVATFWATFGKTWATFYSNIWSHWWPLLGLIGTTVVPIFLYLSRVNILHRVRNNSIIQCWILKTMNCLS